MAASPSSTAMARRSPVGRAGHARDGVPLGLGIQGRRGDDGRQARRAGQGRPQRAGRELCADASSSRRGNEYRATVGDMLATASASIATPTTTSWRKGRTRASCARALAQLNAICPPGTCWSYQNVAYDGVERDGRAGHSQPYEQAVEADAVRSDRHDQRQRDAGRAWSSSKSWARPHSAGPRPLRSRATFITGCRPPAASTATSRTCRCG